MKREEIDGLAKAARAADEAFTRAIGDSAMEEVIGDVAICWGLKPGRTPGVFRIEFDVTRIQENGLRSSTALMNVSANAMTRAAEIRTQLDAWERNEAEWPLAKAAKEPGR
jgi:hypothetical protein